MSLVEKLENHYYIQPEILIRSPLLPFSYIDQVKDNEDLINLFKDNLIQEALFFSSLEFYKVFNDKLNNSDFSENDKVFDTLFKYLSRMIGRPTPFGAFAGISVVPISEGGTHVITESLENFKIKSKLDSALLFYITQKALEFTEIRNYVKFYSNNSIYKIKDSTRYINYDIYNIIKHYKLVQINPNTILDAIIEQCKNGCVHQDIIQFLTDNYKLSPEKGKYFLDQLIDKKIIISELEPYYLGEDQFELITERLVEILAQITVNETRINKDVTTYILGLKKIEKQFNILKEEKSTINRLKNYNKILERITADLKLEKITPYPLQADLIKPIISGSLSTNTVKTISEAIELINKLNADTEESHALVLFRNEFFKRFEYDEVPLNHVFDPDTGIPYNKSIIYADASPLADDLVLPVRPTPSLSWNRTEMYLFDLYLGCLKNDITEIEIKQKDIESFESKYGDLPISIPVLFNILKSGNKELINFRGAGGFSSATSYLGRFSSFNSEVLSLSKNIIQQEESLLPDNAVYAEIVYNPGNYRIGNILQRPHLRKYQIEYMAGKVRNDTDITTIPLEDIFISIKNNEIVLRSKKLNKIIIPSLGCAHNFSKKTLPIYNFLCDLQTQSSRKILKFSWGKLSKYYSFFPRVVYKNVIISPKTWKFTDIDYQLLCNVQTDEELLLRIAEFILKYKLPTYIGLVEGDNELIFNLDNLLSVKSFVNILKIKERVFIIEINFDLNCNAVTNENGSYYNQFVLTYSRKTVPDILKNISKIQFDQNTPPHRRKNAIGEDWLFVKCYTGQKSSDQLLMQLFYPLAVKLYEEGVIKKWFFIRYTDPDFHLRIRYELTEKGNFQKITQYLNELTNDFPTIWKIQLDTYIPEYTRYGVRNLEMVENVFYHDSISQIKLLDLINTDKQEDLRWIYGLKSINAYLDLFKLSLEEKHAHCCEIDNYFDKEFFEDKNLKLQIDAKYRKSRLLIEKTLFNKEKDDLDRIITNRDEKIKPFTDAIVNNNKNYGDNIPLSSIIHMSINRLFRSKIRLQEFILHSLLKRHYKSLIARNTYSIKTT